MGANKWKDRQRERASVPDQIKPFVAGCQGASSLSPKQAEVIGRSQAGA